MIVSKHCLFTSLSAKCLIKKQFSYRVDSWSIYEHISILIYFQCLKQIRSSDSELSWKSFEVSLDHIKQCFGERKKNSIEIVIWVFAIDLLHKGVFGLYFCYEAVFGILFTTKSSFEIETVLGIFYYKAVFCNLLPFRCLQIIITYKTKNTSQYAKVYKMVQEWNRQRQTSTKFINDEFTLIQNKIRMKTSYTSEVRFCLLQTKWIRNGGSFSKWSLLVKWEWVKRLLCGSTSNTASAHHTKVSEKFAKIEYKEMK